MTAFAGGEGGTFSLLWAEWSSGALVKSEKPANRRTRLCPSTTSGFVAF